MVISMAYNLVTRTKTAGISIETYSSIRVARDPLVGLYDVAVFARDDRTLWLQIVNLCLSMAVNNGIRPVLIGSGIRL